MSSRRLTPSSPATVYPLHRWFFNSSSTAWFFSATISRSARRPLNDTHTARASWIAAAISRSIIDHQCTEHVAARRRGGFLEDRASSVRDRRPRRRELTHCRSPPLRGQQRRIGPCASRGCCWTLPGRAVSRATGARPQVGMQSRGGELGLGEWLVLHSRARQVGGLDHIASACASWHSVSLKAQHETCEGTDAGGAVTWLLLPSSRLHDTSPGPASLMMFIKVLCACD